MPRRPAPRAPADTEASHSTSLPASSATSELLATLRTNWKWAAFGQFFYTFSPLFAMDDVSINDIEEDLVYGSRLVLPRIIIRLLFVLTYDRKVSSNNWQTLLRKQYNKRDPLANPIGPEPAVDEEDHAATEENTTPEPSTEPKPEDDTGQVKEEDEESAPVEFAAPVVLLAKKYHYLVNEAQAAELDGRESKDWLDLPMLEKLDSLHLLTEWQFHNPTRVRTMMKTDDEAAEWRIEPIGYDAKRNAYWLIGADRLWIQREPPRPPKQANSLKRKRPTTARATSSAKRQRVQAEANGRGNKSKKAVPAAVNGRGGRAAKAQAKLKLNAQAKELEELNRQAALLAQSRNGTSSRARTRNMSTASGGGRSLGTRVSARLRGTPDDEWQPIPDAWLNASNDDDEEEESQPKPPKRSPRKKLKTGLESDTSSISDLTELSGEEEEDNDEPLSPVQEDESESESEEPEEPEPELKEEEPAEPPGLHFVEWETICVTLDEWEHIAERWQGATHYAEKAFYKVLTKSLVPFITEQLREIERKKTLEEAVVHRKRSSRIAFKEHAKEEARIVAKKKQEEDERNGRAKRAEARQLKEENARLRREQAREQRRQEEEEEEERKNGKHKENEDTPVDVVGEYPSSLVPHVRISRQQMALLHPPHPPTDYGSGTSTPSDWELDCEICNRKGINVDDGVPLASCEDCRKWQHIACHDLADQQAGRPRRNWKKVDFLCRHCRLRRAAAAAAVAHHPHPSSHPSLTLRIPPISSLNHHGVPAVNPYAQPQAYMHTPAKPYMPPAQEIPQKALSFSHYHPQQQGFSNAPSHYIPSGATQSYSQLAASQHQPQYHQQAMGNGHVPQAYQHTNGWNVNRLPPNMYVPTYPGEANTGWSPQPTAGASSAQFNYYPASYQAHS